MIHLHFASEVVLGSNISTAWLRAVRYLCAYKYQVFGLVVVIDNPLATEPNIHRAYEDLLGRHGLRSSTKVAKDIFPFNDTSRWIRKPEASNLRYLHLLENRKKGGWGTYFERMIHWPNGDGTYLNQLEQTINKLKNRRVHQRNWYQISLYHPSSDINRLMGLPCLSTIDFKVDQGNTLHLCAHYRNHWFVRRAYGNYLGLGRLLSAAAQAAGLRVGKVHCVSDHAEVEHGYRRSVKLLLARFADELAAA